MPLTVLASAKKPYITASTWSTVIKTQQQRFIFRQKCRPEDNIPKQMSCIHSHYNYSSPRYTAPTAK